MWVRLMDNWCKYRKYKCWLYLRVDVLNRKIGVKLRSESIARRAGWWWMGRVQKIRMFKCTPHHPKINTYFWIFILNEVYDENIDRKIFMEIKSKSINKRKCVWLYGEKQLIVMKYEHIWNSQGNMWKSTSIGNRNRPQSVNLARDDVKNGNL